MKIAIAPKAPGRSGMYKRTCSGIKVASHDLVTIKTVDDLSKIKDCDILCLNGYRHFQLRGKAKTIAKDNNVPIVYIDNGTFEYFGSHLLVTVNGIKRHGMEYVDNKSDSPRLKFTKHFQLKDWTNQDKKLITTLAHNIHGYKLLTQTKKHQLRLIKSANKSIKDMGYEVQTSWHPRMGKKTLSMGSVYKKSLCCVGWHTNALCCALLNGVPTICLDEDSLAYDISSHNIEEIIYPDRTEWFNKLSWANWSKREVGNGKFWPLIIEYLKVNDDNTK